MYTGNTLCVRAVLVIMAVYPCVYREHCMWRLMKALSHGLSLCIQGTLLQIPDNNPKKRFIPVYTGNTLCVRAVLVIMAVYPCVYREHCMWRLMKALSHGLSLCIQGTLLQIPDNNPKKRFIPVYTGNTSGS